MIHTHQRFTAANTDREPYLADCPACTQGDTTMTTPQTTHTPRPWHIAHIDSMDESNVSIDDSNNDAVDIQANAAHIVRCVNRFDDLVGSVRKALDYLADNECALQDSGNWGDEEQDLLEHLQTALAHAEREETQHETPR